MKITRISNWSRIALLACGLFAVTAIGCQTDIGGQSLPSGYYLGDDIQFFPAGPEFIIPNQVRALEEYRLERQAIQDGLAE